MQSIIAKRLISASLARTPFMAVPAMSFSGKPLGQKEKGDEKVFFNKEDEKVL